MTSISLKFRQDGAIESLKYKEIEFISSTQELFVMQARDLLGNPLQFSSKQFKKVEFQGDDRKLSIHFSGDELLLRRGSVTVTVENDGEEVRWGISAELGDELLELEWFDFPVIRFPVTDDFHYLNTYAEGLLMGKDGLGTLERVMGNQGRGYIGYAPSMMRYFYPGPASAQFHALLRGDIGLYIGFHDSHDTLKLMEAVSDGPEHGKLLQQQFTEGKNHLDYQVVMKGFENGWEDAAEIHRQWLDAQPRPAKLKDSMPAWYDKDPLLVIYPVKGEGLDHYELEPNNAFYPYTKGLDAVKKFHELLPDNPLMPLLMHWEGTAPWAPPYIWPPYGGEDELQKFTDALHAQGDYIGLYGSGIGWTQISAIDHKYDCRKKFQEMHVDKEICTGPVGERFAVTCNHALAGQRIGYDLCPSREFTRKTVHQEVESCRSHGIDYLQYFDQNCGGSASTCYSHDHGHPHLPGPWLPKAMRELMEEAVATGQNTLAIGCENSAAAPYTGACRLNDLRYINAWLNAEPVPLYPYLFHEYSVGFSGNTGGISWFLDFRKIPYYPQFHFAWHFAQGNELAIIPNGNLEVFWGWSLSWSVPAPRQDPILTLLKNLLGWRKGPAKEFLLYGRMERAPQVSCYTLPFPRLEIHDVVPQKPVVLASTWSHQGKKLTLLVNYTETAQPAEVSFAEEIQGTLLANGQPSQSLSGKHFSFVIPSLDAILIQH